jgi:hypothetical protein
VIAVLLVVVGPVVEDQSVLAGTYRSVTAIAVAPAGGYEDARNMLSCI